MTDTTSTVRVTTLSNGLRVATDHMPHVETATVGVWVDAGTRHESAEINGVSHLLEHMAFKGTARRSALQIAEEVEAVGGYMNAYTSRESTVFYLRLLKDDVALGVDILADILQHSTFDEDELERERSVVVQEILSADDVPDEMVFDHFQETAYPDQGLGRSVLGPVETVRAMPRATIADYMRRHYTAKRMVLAAAGNVDHDRIVALAERAFSDLAEDSERTTDPADYRGGDFRRRRDLGQVHLTLGFPGVGYKDPDYPAVNVLATLLGGGMSSRLFQEVREKRGLAYSVFAFANPYADGGLFGIYTASSGEDASKAVPLIIDETRKVTEGVRDEEVRRAVVQLKASLLMGLESSTARAERLGQHLLVHGRLLDQQEQIAELEAVDPDRVARVARRLFSAGPMTVAALGRTENVARYDDLAGRFSDLR